MNETQTQADVQRKHQAHIDAINSLIKTLQVAVNKHGLDENGEPTYIHYGHVGDLGHVREELAELVAFMDCAE